MNSEFTHRRQSQGMLWVVEAWRGLAALVVVWAHWGLALGWPVGPMAFAFTGVDLFFVLSGFVFAPTMLERAPPVLAAYGLRRLSRIYPAYLAALALYAALAWQAGKPLLYLPEHLLMAHLQSREMTFYYNPVFWSLPVELSFYLLVPLLGGLLAGAAALRQARCWAALFALALAMRFALLHLADGAAQNLAYLLLHHLPGLLAEFLLGAVVWQHWRATGVRGGAQSGMARPVRADVLLGLVGLLGWLALAALFRTLESCEQSWRNGQLSLAAAVCFAAMLRASLRLPATRLGLWAAQWGGRLSYSMYLLHMAWLAPALAWTARWGVTAGTALALAGLLLSCLALHGLIEEPARRWGRRIAQRWEHRRGQGPSPAGGSTLRS